VGEAPITPDFALRLGYAAGSTLLRREKLPHDERPRVLIGKDTRVSGYMLEAALEAGFAAAGVDVLLAGPVPTPAVAYLTRALRLQAGVVISASHNPYFDNGIKFFSAAGSKLPDQLEHEIEEQLDSPMQCADSASIGRARRVDDAAGRYIEFCKSTFPTELDLRGLRIAVDCAHGAAYHIAPKVFHELGAEVVASGVEPNGLRAARPSPARRRRRDGGSSAPATERARPSARTSRRGPAASAPRSSRRRPTSRSGSTAGSCVPYGSRRPRRVRRPHRARCR
jgi:phosphoglucosamine mutase